ncbi:hypothetical protein WJX72_007384 [[Myrmecia] bisecta]|uniref:Uncharacterized protein n=1 Tax=[Myrmecia] bisecta TaxID=41462 RepID=A0AAW1Q512_9CHLO
MSPVQIWLGHHRTAGLAAMPLTFEQFVKTAKEALEDHGSIFCCTTKDPPGREALPEGKIGWIDLYSLYPKN